MNQKVLQDPAARRMWLPFVIRISDAFRNPVTAQTSSRRRSKRVPAQRVRMLPETGPLTQLRIDFGGQA